MTQIVVSKEQTTSAVFSDEHISLIKNTVCRGSTDQELELFLYTAKQTGLNPLLGQIHAVKRFDKSVNGEVMKIQIGVDGYRLIAERTGRYAPGRDTVFNYDKNGRLVSARAFVKKRTQDGAWHEVGATAFYAESVQTNREGQPVLLWKTKPHLMLEKTAECAALRKAFPHDVIGSTTAPDESHSPIIEDSVEIHKAVSEEEDYTIEEKISRDQVKELLENIGANPDLLQKLLKWAGIELLTDLPVSKFNQALHGIEENRKKLNVS